MGRSSWKTALPECVMPCRDALRASDAPLFHSAALEEWPTIRPLVPVNTTALLGSNSLILPL